jgi:3-isopropylmalate/(R)-2-methylmalate dehydratase small subunit
MNEIREITGTGIPLLLDDIDTDRIIPARYLRCVTFDGIGEHAFEDDRQQDPNHPFNDERFQNASVLISRRNFGCGSSREHAPQSLMRWGIKVIIAESFAEIFFGNCTSLGIPAVTAAREDLQMLCDTIQNDPSAQITVNLETQTVQIGDQSFSASMPESARSALTTGNWDFLAQLLEGKDAVQAAASQLPYVSGFAS